MNNDQAGSKNTKIERESKSEMAQNSCVCVFAKHPLCSNYAAKFLLSSVLLCSVSLVVYPGAQHRTRFSITSARHIVILVVAFEARAVLNIKINRKQGHIPCACISPRMCVCVCVCVRYTQNHCRCVVRNVLNRAQLIHSSSSSQLAAKCVPQTTNQRNSHIT